MGYTHYFSFKGNKIPAKAFDAVVKDVKKIEDYIKNNVVHSKNAGNDTKDRVTLHDGWGKGKGIKYTIEETAGKRTIVEFMLNGTEKGDLYHEAFYLKRGVNGEGLGGFCKTARKPYDLVVCMILLSTQYHLNTAKISSDGDLADWEHSIELWQQIFADRPVEVVGLSIENPNLYIVRLEKPVKPMKIKKNAFNLVK